MRLPKTEIVLALALASLNFLPGQTPAPIPFIISVENVPGHFQAKATRAFAERLQAKAGKALNVQYYDGASLYRDADVLLALARGKVACAFPGLWQLDGQVPDAAAFMLPTVYGRPAEAIEALADGRLGGLISRQVESALECVVIGPWLDLGYGHLFGARTDIRRAADLAGMSIRVAGGRGNEERMRAFGARPILLSSTDLPAYLKAHLLDGVLTTYVTVASSGLDRVGLRTVLEDREYYPFFLPLVSRQVWARLSPGLRQAVVSSWAEVVGGARAEARAAQESAKAELVARGLVVHLPSEADLAATRAFLLGSEDAMAARLSVSPEALAALRSGFAAPGDPR